MTVVKEFREFIAKGNVIDLAVGVIIGAAFGKIVTSLVEQVVMPPIGLLLGQVDFSDLKLVLKPEDVAAKTDEVAVLYGAFINTVIQFLIVAMAVFLMVKLVNHLRRMDAAEPGPAAPAAPTATETLLMEIRDSLKAGPAPKPAKAAAPVVAKAAPKAKPAAKPATAAKKPAAKKK
jgi:large conductance mechanosensitive channel